MTWSELLKKGDPLKVGGDGFSYFFIDFQLFYFLTKIIIEILLNIVLNKTPFIYLSEYCTSKLDEFEVKLLLDIVTN